MNARALLLALAAAAAAAPAGAQLRATPDLGSVRSAPSSSAQRPADYIVAVVNSEPITNNEVRTRMLLGRLREREVEQRVKITELDVEQFLREQAASTDGPVELNLGHILVAVPENASEQQVRESRAKADKLLERARAGEDFAKLARESSDAPGAAQSGGLMGLRGADRYPTLFLEAVQSLPQGGVSNVVRSGAGFHLLKVVDRRKGGMPGMTVTQNHARHILLRPSPQLSEAAARDRLAEMKRRIQSGQADFAQLAREFSQDASAQRGGDLGWSSPGMFVPEFEDAINALSPGQIADPLVSRFGVHLVQLIERRVAPLTQREQRDAARNLLREKKLDEAYERWAQDVRGRAFVDLREPPQ